MHHFHAQPSLKDKMDLIHAHFWLILPEPVKSAWWAKSCGVAMAAEADELQMPRGDLLSRYLRSTSSTESINKKEFVEEFVQSQAHHHPPPSATRTPPLEYTSSDTPRDDVRAPSLSHKKTLLSQMRDFTGKFAYSHSAPKAKKSKKAREKGKTAGKREKKLVTTSRKLNLGMRLLWICRKSSVA